jgi:hypothetical protein
MRFKPNGEELEDETLIDVKIDYYLPLGRNGNGFGGLEVFLLIFERLSVGIRVFVHFRVVFHVPNFEQC